MKKRPIRLVAVLLAMLMCLTLLPVTAMAEIAELPAKVLTALQSSEGVKALFTPEMETQTVTLAAPTAPTEWPKLSELTLNEGAQLVVKTAGAPESNNREIKKVSYENYSEPKLISEGDTSSTYSVGKVTLQINAALSSDWTYKISDGALSKNFTAMPDGVTATDKFEPVTISPNQEIKGRAFAKSDAYSFIYEFEVVVGAPAIEHDYPVITELSLSPNAVLTGTDSSTVTIVAATFENYDDAQNSESSSGTAIKISGKVTLYVLKELGNLKYKLAAQTVNATYSEKEGFTTNYLQGSIPAGKTSSVSSSYAINEESRLRYYYNLEIVVGYPDNGMYVVEGSASRIRPTTARVTFTASKLGTFHYACVDADADVPTMPSEHNSMKAGENTLVIDGLTDGAKKVYIWGEDVSGKVSQPLVVNVPAEAVSYSLTFMPTAVDTDGIFRITADGREVSFNTRIMVTPTTKASGLYEGQTVTVWMGNPYTDKDLSSVTLRNVTDVTIAEDKNSFSFTMPAADVYGTSDDWRTYADSTETRYTLTGTSSTFDQTNKAGIAMGSIVFKDEDDNIIRQAKEGMVVTATPVPDPLANYTLEFAFTEWSNAAGFTLNKNDKTTPSLTFTVGKKNVSLKANFKPVGTKVTWGTNLPTTSENAPVVSFASNLMESPYVFKKIAASVSIRGDKWYDQYEFVRWKITRDETELTETELDTSQNVGTPDTPGYWCVPKFDISGDEMTVTAIFQERANAQVTAKANDPARGSVTAAIEGGKPAAVLPVVFKGKTVILTATPGDRYTLTGWEVKEEGSDTLIPTTPVEGNANQATFTMPATDKSITATAIFAVDPAKASDKKVLETVALYQSNGTTLVVSGNRQGTAFTITLPANTDTSDLANMILKLTVSEYATVKKSGDTDNWPAEGKACGMELDKAATFTVTAENNTTQDYTVTITKAKSSEKNITAAVLLNQTGDITPLAVGTVSEDKVIFTLPANTDKAVLNSIGMKYLKLTYPETATAKMVNSDGQDAYDDTTGPSKWRNGDVMCNMSLNTPVTFIITAEDGSPKTYTVEIKYTAPNAPTLSGGSAARSSKTAATVKFTTSMAGNYFYKVVAKGAAAPTVDTTRGGTTAVKGENTITLTNLSTGARDIYIVVKSLSNVECDPFKIEIPAYGSTETPDEGDFTIRVDAPPTGGTITTNRTRANEGDEIIVTVTPKTGYQMKAGSLRYAFSEPGAAYTAITGYSFKMPGGDVSITCDWETASTTVNGITAFSINGVAAAVNNTTNTITITMPRGTDVTKLTPVIATNGVKSLTPGNGETVNFTNAVTYTAAMEDGSSKTYTVTVYVDKGTLADQFWDKLTDFATQVPWWQYAEKQQSTSKYPKYW